MPDSLRDFNSLKDVIFPDYDAAMSHKFKSIDKSSMMGSQKQSFRTMGPGKIEKSMDVDFESTELENQEDSGVFSFKNLLKKFPSYIKKKVKLLNQKHEDKESQLQLDSEEENQEEDESINISFGKKQPTVTMQSTLLVKEDKSTPPMAYMASLDSTLNQPSTDKTSAASSNQSKEKKKDRYYDGYLDKKYNRKRPSEQYGLTSSINEKCQLIEEEELPKADTKKPWVKYNTLTVEAKLAEPS